MSTPLGDRFNAKWEKFYDQRQWLFNVIADHWRSPAPPVFVMLQVERARAQMRPETFEYWTLCFERYMTLKIGMPGLDSVQNLQVLSNGEIFLP